MYSALRRTVTTWVLRMQFKVFTGASEEELQVMYAQGASAWCYHGLSCDSFFHAGVKECDITISPFGETLIAIVPNGPAAAARPANCTLSEASELSVQLVAVGAAGALLVATAPALATSIVFRMSVGGTLTVLLFTVIASIVMMRCAYATAHACATTVSNVLQLMAHVLQSGLASAWHR